MSNPPSPPPSDPEAPALDPVIVADDEALGEAVDRFIANEPVANARLHFVADHQELLRQAVDSEMWRLILMIDEAVVERWADLAVALARWSFETGRCFPLPLEASP